MTRPATIVSRTTRALAALAIDPVGLNGMTIRARTGPVRARLESQLARLPGPMRRISPTVSDQQLFGGLNVAATLAEGRPVSDPGLEASPATLVIPMAERIPSDVAARLGLILDRGAGHSLILLDEGSEPDETVPAALRDRIAFHVDLNALSYTDAQFLLPAPADIDHACACFASLRVSAEDLSRVTVLAARYGIDNLRVPTMTAYAARALAALDRCEKIDEVHIVEAVELVLPHHARCLPDDVPDAPADQEQTQTDAEKGETEAAASTTLPEDILIDAVAALLPPDVLTENARGRSARRRPTGGSGAGGRRLGNRRGRPLPSRPGKPDGRNRIDPVATLRTAAPWQHLRRAGSADDTRAILIYPGDIRLRRYEERSDRLLIFVVDASGSAAVARLSEAKGAVEMLLAQAYAKRDHVALIAFRGTGADLLLPPTRSLVQGKRRLAALPGGGGTPLAAGLEAALAQVNAAQGRGLSPMLALLTDGRANIGLDGTAGREAAAHDVRMLATHLRAAGVPGVVIDTSIRPGRDGAVLAEDLNARYLALPRADASRISVAVDTVLST